MMGKQPWRGADGIWRYSPLDKVMAESGLEEVDNYVERRQKTAAQYISTHLIMGLCMEAQRCPIAGFSICGGNRDVLVC